MKNGRLHFNESGLVALFRDVATYIPQFWENDAPNVVFGARERWKIINTDVRGSGNRIVIVPGALEGGDGTPTQPVGPGEDASDTSRSDGGPAPRRLFTQPKPVTFCLWAIDNSTPDALSDEALQQEAIEQMQEFVYRAVKLSDVGRANGVWSTHKYNRDPNELRYGTEYQMTLIVDSPFFDLDRTAIFPSAAVVSRDPPT